MSSIVEIRNKFPRVLGMSSFDILGTMVFAYPISYYTDTSFTKSFIGLFVLGEVLHVVFKQETPVIKFIKDINKKESDPLNESNE